MVVDDPRPTADPPPTARARTVDGVPESDPRIRTFGLLLEAHGGLVRRLDEDLRHRDGISLQTLEVLLRISRSPDGLMTMSDLAGQVALSTGGVTRLADRLADDGLVERRSCPSDRRRVHLALTPVGADVLGRALPGHLDALETHMAARIAPEDLIVFERVLDSLRS